MNKTIWLKVSGLLALFALIFVFSSAVSAQGKGKGNGRGNSNAGRGNSNNPNKSDDSLWNGFPDDKNKNKQNRGGRDNIGKSQRFKGLSKKLGVSPETLQARYEYERRLNPDLMYGQFVAANMIAKNHRGISAGDILDGLRDGRSIGQTLKNKGWDREKIDKERKRIRDIYKDDNDYDDRDDYWRFGF